MSAQSRDRAAKKAFAVVDVAAEGEGHPSPRAESRLAGLIILLSSYSNRPFSFASSLPWTPVPSLLPRAACRPRGHHISGRPDRASRNRSISCRSSRTRASFPVLFFQPRYDSTLSVKWSRGDQAQRGRDGSIAPEKLSTCRQRQPVTGSSRATERGAKEKRRPVANTAQDG